MAFGATKKIVGRTFGNTSTKRFGGKPFLPIWFDYTIVDQPRALPGSSSNVTVADAVYNQVSGSKTYYDKKLTFNNLTNVSSLSFSSSNTSVATVNASGLVTQLVDSGSVNITVTATAPDGQTFVRVIPITLAYTGSSTTQTYLYGVAGSVRKHIEDTVLARIATPKDKLIYSTQDHTNKIYTRNTNCWAYGYDLTPISPWNSSGGAHQAGTLITPQDIILANHYGYGVGTVVRFVNSTGTVYERSVTATRNPASDIFVAHLDSAVPGDIDFCRVLPKTWANKFPNAGRGIPAIVLDQEEKALIDEVYYVSSSNMTSFQYPVNTQYVPYYESLISGDSGNPAMLMINGKLVVLTTWWYGGAGSGPSVVYNYDAINSALTNMGSTYQMTDIDLSGFNTY